MPRKTQPPHLRSNATTSLLKRYPMHEKNKSPKREIERNGWGRECVREREEEREKEMGGEEVRARKECADVTKDSQTLHKAAQESRKTHKKK